MKPEYLLRQIKEGNVKLDNIPKERLLGMMQYTVGELYDLLACEYFYRKS